MRQSEAMAIVQRLQSAGQKCRSNLFETFETFGADEEMAEKTGADLYPWLFGDRNFLRATSIVIERGSIEPSEFYNLMWIAARPELRALLGVWLTVSSLPDFPEPDVSWIGQGWEVEV